MGLNVGKILRRTEMSLDEAIKAGHATLSAAQSDGSVRSERGYIRSDMFASGWKLGKTSGDTEVLFKLIEVLCIYTSEHAEAGPPTIADDVDAADATDALNVAFEDGGVTPAKLLRDFNNGSYLSAVARAKPKKAGASEDLEIAFITKHATDAAMMSKFISATLAKTKKEFLKAWFASTNA